MLTVGLSKLLLCFPLFSIQGIIADWISPLLACSWSIQDMYNTWHLEVGFANFVLLVSYLTISMKFM